MNYRQRIMDWAMDTEDTATLKKVCRIIDGEKRRPSKYREERY